MSICSQPSTDRRRKFSTEGNELSVSTTANRIYCIAVARAWAPPPLGPRRTQPRPALRQPASWTQGKITMSRQLELMITKVDRTTASR